MVKAEGSDPEWSALVNAGRALVAGGGLKALSLRSIAEASGWTMGELGYRIGKKEQLLALLIEAEGETARAADAAWLARMSSLRTIDSATFAAVVGGYLDDCAANRRVATIFWEELVLEAGLDPGLCSLVAPRLDEREGFWHQLLVGRHPEGVILARIITNFVAEEQLHTLVLGQNPTYRLMRDIRIRRLCGGLLADAGSPDGAFFEDLLVQLQPASPGVKPLPERAQAVARMTANLMMEQGLAAITHRGVAAALGMSPSAVAHHFRARVDLVRGGIEAMYDAFYALLDVISIRQRLQADGASRGGMIDPAGAGAGLARATHMVALASARDSLFVPLVARRLTERGRSSGSWIGELFRSPERFDRCAAQITSMVLGGEVILSLARGLPYTGQSSAGLADLVALAG